MRLSNLLLAFLVATGGPSQAASIALNYRFSFSSTPQTFVNPVVALNDSAGWVLAGTNTPATNAQIQDVLSNVTLLMFTGRGSTSSPALPYGFVLQNPNLAGLVSDTFPPENGWVSGSGPFIAGPLGFAFEGSWGSPTALTAIAPAKYLGNQSAAFGGNLTFSFAILQISPVHTYDVDSGTVVVIGGSIPEPGTWTGMLLGGLAVLGFRLRAARHRQSQIQAPSPV